MKKSILFAAAAAASLAGAVSCEKEKIVEKEVTVVEEKIVRYTEQQQAMKDILEEAGKAFSDLVKVEDFAEIDAIFHDFNENVFLTKEYDYSLIGWGLNYVAVNAKPVEEGDPLYGRYAYRLHVDLSSLNVRFTVVNGKWTVSESERLELSYTDSEGQEALLAAEGSGETRTVRVSHERLESMSLYVTVGVPAEITLTQTIGGKEVMKAEFANAFTVTGDMVDFTRDGLSIAGYIDLAGYRTDIEELTYNAGNYAGSVRLAKDNTLLGSLSLSGQTDGSVSTMDVIDLDLMGKIQLKGSCSDMGSYAAMLAGAALVEDKTQKGPVEALLAQANRLASFELFYNGESDKRADVQFIADRFGADYIPFPAVKFPDGEAYESLADFLVLKDFGYLYNVIVDFVPHLGSLRQIIRKVEEGIEKLSNLMPDTPDPVETEAVITDTVSNAGLFHINFLYPSTGPDGSKVTLSGTISMGEALFNGRTANGFLLYNHYTVLRADQCPSRGMLDFQTPLAQMVPSLLIVSADYFGFGATEAEMQAYCYGDDNARASIDALLAAEALLTNAGYTWGDKLFNVGYSQGGQTAIAVQKLVDTSYPDITITRTMAGAGPYDFSATGRQLLTQETAGSAGIVAMTLIAFNAFSHLGYSYSDIFQEPLASHIDDWILQKKYSTDEVDALIGTNRMEDLLQPGLRDPESSMAQAFLNAFSGVDLTSGWSPDPDDDIYLLHSTIDDIVPTQNTVTLYNFLEAAGVEKENLEIVTGDFDLGSAASPHSATGEVFTGRVALYLAMQQ